MGKLIVCDYQVPKETEQIKTSLRNAGKWNKWFFSAWINLTTNFDTEFFNILTAKFITFDSEHPHSNHIDSAINALLHLTY